MLDGGANLMGHSFGGAEALLAAARDPMAVRSLILIEPALWPLLEYDPQAYSSPVIQAERQLRDEDLMNAKTPADYASRFLGSFQPKKSGFKELAARTAIKLIPGLSKKIGCGVLNSRGASGEQLREAAAVVAKKHIPVLVITGGWSPSRDVLGDIVAKATGGRHVIVKSPNHIIMSSNPTDFNSTATAFMRDADRMRSKAD
jgi:pimeloyl-ACP methyl ester carboxylesterase